MSQSLVNLVDLLTQMRRDEQQDEASLRERDRAIGRTLEPHGPDRQRRVLAWLAAMRGPGVSTGERAAAAVRIITVVLALLGAALGYGAAAAVFHYDGTRPVNVAHVLAAFVLAPLLLLAMTLLLLLPRGWSRWVPGLIGVQETLGLISPARLANLIERTMPQDYRTALSNASGRTRAHQAVFGQVHKWLLLTWSQTFAAMFFAGALGGCLSLVIFSDLAFGWSTTLRVGAQDFYRLTQALAWPWAWLWPGAAPSADLVLGTQYFRFGGGQLSGRGEGVETLGDWWPFLVMCIACYALLPRLATLCLARVRLHQSVEQTLLRVPGVTALLDRLDSELVRTTADEDDVTDVPESGEPRPSSDANVQGRRVVVIDWSSAAGSEQDARRLASMLGATVTATLTAGGLAQVEDDVATAQRAAELANAPDTGVLVLVRAWEPPLLELLDFLRDLRAKLGPGRDVVVAARGESGPPRPLDLEVWSKTLARLGDPWLSVRPAHSTTEGEA